MLDTTELAKEIGVELIVEHLHTFAHDVFKEISVMKIWLNQ